MKYEKRIIEAGRKAGINQPKQLIRLAIVKDGEYFINGSDVPATDIEIEEWKASGNFNQQPVALHIGSNCCAEHSQKDLVISS